MSDFIAARSQMAMSLAFHIIFAAVGIGMPIARLACAQVIWRAPAKGSYTERRIVQRAIKALCIVDYL